MTETRATLAARRGLARAGRARAGARGARGSSRCSTRTSFEPARLAFQGARVSRTTAAAARHGGRRFGARGGGKRGGAPREHLQLLHAAVVSLIVETTFARHNSAGGSGRDGGQNTRGTCAISRRLGARARATERKNSARLRSATPLARSTGIRRDRRARRGSERPFARRCPSGTSQRRRRRERDEMRAPDAPRTLSRALVRHARRSGFAAPAANGGGPTSSRGCAPCGPNAHLFGLRLRNRAFVTKGTCDARGRRAAKVSDVAARRVSRRGTSGGCALAIFGRRVV